MARVVPTESQPKTVSVFPAGKSDTETFGFTIDVGPDSEISPGFKGYLPISYTGTISGWWITTDNEDGEITIDILRPTGPVEGDSPIGSASVCAAAYPNVAFTSSGKGETSLWTNRTVTADDLIGFEVLSCSGISRATLVLLVTT